MCVKCNVHVINNNDKNDDGHCATEPFVTERIAFGFAEHIPWYGTYTKLLSE